MNERDAEATTREPGDPVDVFTSVAARHRRCFWLDGGGAREWSGRRSIIGWLADDDVSLTWSAARREVRAHSGGSSSVVGDDVFAVLDEWLRPDEQWFGYLGYASRTDLPAAPDPTLPDAVWMRPSAVRVFEHPPSGSPADRGSLNLSARARPDKFSESLTTPAALRLSAVRRGPAGSTAGTRRCRCTAGRCAWRARTGGTARRA